MAINKKLISFATQAQFTNKLNAGDIDNRSIVFIENTKRIWTHGVYFDTSWNYVGDKPSTFNPSAHTLGSHSDVTISSNSNGEILKWNGSRWINNTLAEAGIATPSDITTAIGGIKIGGRNLVSHRPENWEHGGISDWTGGDWSNPARIRTVYIPIKPSTYYVLTIYGEGWVRGSWLNFYDSEYNRIASPNIIESTPFQSPENTSFIRFQVYKEDNSNITPQDAISVMAKLEKGNKATDWTPAPEDQVSDWNESNTTSFSYIKNKPTTLTGYGITDAVTINTTQTITGAKNFTGNLQKNGVNVALINGTYSGLRAQATTKADVGLSQVPNLDFRNYGVGRTTANVYTGGDVDVDVATGLYSTVASSTANTPIFASSGAIIMLQSGASGNAYKSQIWVKGNANTNNQLFFRHRKGTSGWNSWDEIYHTGNFIPGNYSDINHKHNASDITSGILNIARIPTGTTNSTVVIGNDSRVNNGQTAFGWGNHANLYINKGSSIGDVDLNTIFTEGSYRMSTSSWANSGNNYPSGAIAGQLLVFGDNTYAKQIYKNRTGRQWERFYWNSWSNWLEVWNSDNFSQTNINNWSSAYGWGNHAGLYPSRGSVGGGVNSMRSADTRNVDEIPTTDRANGLWLDYKVSSAIGLSGKDSASRTALLTILPYVDVSGNSLAGHRLALSNNHLYIQKAGTSSYSNWETVYDSSNLNLTTLGGVPTSRTITAGNGLTGGGNLTANRTLTLGTPSNITATSTNSVNATSHTHAIDGSSLVVLESNRLNVPDTRSVDSPPSSIPSKTITAFFKTNAIVNAPPVTTGSTYAHILNMNGYNSGNTGGGGHTTQLAFGDSLAIRQSTSTTAWGAWTRLALVTDNVASATKLQTARTIWGRSFNGTGNVSGAITGATTGSFSGTITASGGNSNQWNSAYGWGNHASVGYYDISKITGYYTPTGGDLNNAKAGERGLSSGSLNQATSGHNDVVTISQYGTNDLLQITWPFRGNGSIYHRNKGSGTTWSNWVEVYDSKNLRSNTQNDSRYLRIVDSVTQSVNGLKTFTSNITSAGFIKTGSNNNYVLLGGGNHKLSSDFILSTGGTLSGEISIVKNGQAGVNTRFLTLRDTDYSTNQGRVDIAMLATNTNTATNRGAVISMQRTNNLGTLHFEVAENNLLSLIGHSQNVGIGTTSPAYKLDVSGTGRFTGNVTAPTITASTSVSTPRVSNGDTYIRHTPGSHTIISSESGGMVYLRPNGDTNSSNQVTINGSGVLSLPSLTASTSVTAPTGSFSSILSANRIVVTSTSNEKHLEFSRSDYNYITSKGHIGFITGGTGTSSANQQVWIHSNGNTKIGAGSSSVPAYTLDVNGTGRFIGNVTAPTFVGNASSATKLASITTTFTGTYPVTFNVNGTIYSHTGITYTGSTGALTATSFVGNLTGNATSATRLTTINTYDANDIIGGAAFNYNSASSWINAPSGMNYGLIGNVISRGSNSLSLQLASDINHNSTSSTKNLWFRTGNNLGFQNDWKKVWHSGNLANGSTSQYIRGDGSLATYANTTYSTGTLAQLNAGTNTTGRLQSAKLLNDWLNPKLNGKLNLTGGTLSGSLVINGGATSLSLIRTSSSNANILFEAVGGKVYAGKGKESDFVIGSAADLGSNSNQWMKVNSSGVTASTFVGALSGNASSATTASKLTINSSASASWYNILWNSGTTVYGSASNKLRVQPSTGSITSGGTITASGGNSNQWNSAYGWGNHASGGYVKGGGHFKAIDIPQTSSGSYQERIVLLLPYVSTNTSHTNFINGEITALKNGGNVVDFFKIRGNCVWNSNLMQIESSGQRSNHKLVTCMYNGVKWIALKIGYTANPHTNFRFYGNHNASSALDIHNDALRVISYYNVSSATALVEEINNSIADFTPNFDSFLNGNKLWHSGNLTQVSQLTNNAGYITSSASITGNAATATALTTNAGSATQPVYFSGGKPVATTYSLGKSVPSSAVFTDTNTYVTQSTSTTASYRPILLGQNSTNSTSNFSNVTNQSYYSNALRVQPSTGNIVSKGSITASSFIGALSGNASSATKVNNNLTLKFDSGTTENTNLYTYNGSAAKTIDIKAGSNVSFTKTANTITVSSTNTNTTYSEITQAQTVSTSSSAARLITGRRLKYAFDNITAANATTATNATNTTNINTLADNSSNAARFILFSDTATGNQRAKTDSGLKYNPSSNTITAKLAGNASSASKLQTARTIWGQSFNGSGNITGNISNTGNITPSATALSNIGTSSLMYERAYLRRIDTQPGYDLRFNVSGSECMTITTSGNVGIGTTSPNYTLDVSGSGRFTGNGLIVTTSVSQYASMLSDSFEVRRQSQMFRVTSSDIQVSKNAGGRWSSLHSGVLGVVHFTLGGGITYQWTKDGSTISLSYTSSNPFRITHNLGHTNYFAMPLAQAKYGYVTPSTRYANYCNFSKSEIDNGHQITVLLIGNG